VAVPLHGIATAQLEEIQLNPGCCNVVSFRSPEVGLTLVETTGEMTFGTCRSWRHRVMFDPWNRAPAQSVIAADGLFFCWSWSAWSDSAVSVTWNPSHRPTALLPGRSPRRGWKSNLNNNVPSNGQDQSL